MATYYDNRTGAKIARIVREMAVDAGDEFIVELCNSTIIALANNDRKMPEQCIGWDVIHSFYDECAMTAFV